MKNKETARERQNVAKKAYDTIIIGVCLSLVGGFLDAYSYLLKGRVFANAQTGNLVLLFVSLSGREWGKALKYLVPVVTFAAGIFFSALVLNKSSVKNHQRLTAVLLFECLAIAAIGLFGVHFPHDIVNSVISFIAAVQVANFDKVDGQPMATTMITGNLKSSMLNAAKYLCTKEERYLHSCLKYLVIITGFGAGVAAGFFAIKLWKEKSLWACEIFIAAAFVALRRAARGNGFER
ncbi:MAG: YoaK family protein [Treponema sp.]